MTQMNRMTRTILSAESIWDRGIDGVSVTSNPHPQHEKETDMNENQTNHPKALNSRLCNSIETFLTKLKGQLDLNHLKYMSRNDWREMGLHDAVASISELKANLPADPIWSEIRDRTVKVGALMEFARAFNEDAWTKPYKSESRHAYLMGQIELIIDAAHIPMDAREDLAREIGVHID